MIHLLCFTNGRGDCLKRTLESFEQHVLAPSANEVMWGLNIINDSPDLTYNRWLNERYGDGEHAQGVGYYNIACTGGNAGFDGAIQHGWQQLVHAAHGDYVFHLEDDFLFNEDIPVLNIMDLLACQPHLMQVALQRQPWAPIEEEAGGVIASNLDQYIEHTDHVPGVASITWCEHRLFFTTNPSIYRLTLCMQGWPEGEHSEARFADSLFAKDPAFRSSYLGGLHDPPKVHHIGDIRLGTRY